MERSFSVNKDVSEQHISVHNLVARRIVKDHIHHIEGPRGVVITKEHLNSALLSVTANVTMLTRRKGKLKRKIRVKEETQRGINCTQEEEKDTTRKIY